MAAMDGSFDHNHYDGDGDGTEEDKLQRSRDRDSLFMKATLRLPHDSSDISARIRNLSSGGLMAEAEIDVARGDLLEIELRNVGWIGGTVAWTSDGRFGVAFHEPIDPKVVRQPVGQRNDNIPEYMRKIAAKPAPRKLRRF